ncbi:GNAT family N-acetyltransferase [Loktanella sp. DJP18]|uniref:GNAT family N-acetyltransferase n=1 Tax=Loktanella sp. DJP18 TaxID=3409788 RepID=UPI003BB67D5E
MTRVALGPYTADQRDAVSALTVAPEQVVFSGQPAAFITQPDADMDIHVIHADGELVGFFRIDLDYARIHDFAKPGDLGLRSVIVDHRQQGRGIGSAAVRALPAYLALHYPGATDLYLTVNLRNPGARKSYLNGGFTDTGAHYLGGDAGPQHIMHMTLTRPGASVENLAPAQVTD